jgi:hypothetical protein
LYRKIYLFRLILRKAVDRNCASLYVELEAIRWGSAKEILTTEPDALM